VSNGSNAGLLTKEEQAKIQWFACETGKTKSELVRQAIERFVDQFHIEDRKSYNPANPFIMARISRNNS